MKITTIEPIKHGGKRHEPGVEITVDDALGEQLIAAGAAERSGKGKGKQELPPPPPGDQS